MWKKPKYMCITLFLSTLIKQLFIKLNKSKDKYGDALNMIDELKTYSFLNKCFVIEKI